MNMKKMIKEKTASAETFLFQALEYHNRGDEKGREANIRWAADHIFEAGAFIKIAARVSPTKVCKK